MRFIAMRHSQIAINAFLKIDGQLHKTPDLMNLSEFINEEY